MPGKMAAAVERSGAAASLPAATGSTRTLDASLHSIVVALAQDCARDLWRAAVTEASSSTATKA